jgi:U3 small nucleolar RNA-associated protein 23
MRILRNKANRKTLQFFRIAFGIHQPYRVRPRATSNLRSHRMQPAHPLPFVAFTIALQVIIDGNFIALALKLKMEWRRLLPKLLQVEVDECHLHFTQCALAELEALGEKATHVVDEAKTLPLLKCRNKHGHPDKCDAASCIKRLVGDRNEGKWLVVTQDAGLRDHLRERVPGTPLILIATNVLILEAPSDASKSNSRTVETAKSALSAEELAAVKRAKAALSGAPMPAASSASTAAAADAGGSSSRSGGASSSSAAGKGSGTMAGKRKRAHHGPSGPNPLSQRKPKARPGDSSTAARPDSESTSGKKRRRKVRKTEGSASVADARSRSGGGDDDEDGGSGSDSE